MAEPIGVASGILTLAVFALQSSVTLYNTIKSFQSHPKRVRDLTEELEALSTVLGPLSETIEAATDVKLTSLKHPLLRCGKACKEFEQELLKCLSRSGSDRLTFRGWAKLKYMGDDIDDFRNLLAGYKLTFNIALTDATLRKASLTAETVENYKELIKTATDDLQAHLESIDAKLDAAVGRTVTDSHPDAAELRQIQEERLSAQNCLQICEQLSRHIDQMQLASQQDSSASDPARPDTFSRTVTNSGLEACKNNLNATVAQLEKHMKELTDRLIMKSRTAAVSEDEASDLARLRDQWEAARQCMDICSKAEVHLKENISTIDNYAIGDAVQFMVSTNGQVIHGKNRGLGWRSRQVGGHLSDDAVKQVSRDMAMFNLKGTGNDASFSHNYSSSLAPETTDNEPTPEFQRRHGTGFTLKTSTS